MGKEDIMSLEMTYDNEDREHPDEEEVNRRLLVDFDRVVHRYSEGWKDGSIYDKEVEGALEAIKKLQANGFEIVIFTALSRLGEQRNQAIQMWLYVHGIDNVEVTNTKLPALAIIDDRAIRFHNWRDILNYYT